MAAAPGSARVVRDAHRRLAGAVAAALAEPPAPPSAPVTSTPVSVTATAARGRSRWRSHKPWKVTFQATGAEPAGGEVISSLSQGATGPVFVERCRGCWPNRKRQVRVPGREPRSHGVPCGLARTAVASPQATPWSRLDEFLDEGERPPLLPRRRAGSRMPGAPDNPYTCTHTRGHVHESGPECQVVPGTAENVA